MAPTALTQSPVDVPQPKFSYNNPSKKVFPDGYKTSGQTEPDYEKIQPYSAFPREISGPTVWETSEYQTRPETWTHRFSEQEVAEISKAADDFMNSGTPLTGITKVREGIHLVIGLSNMQVRTNFRSRILARIL